MKSFESPPWGQASRLGGQRRRLNPEDAEGLAWTAARNQKPETWSGMEGSDGLSHRTRATILDLVVEVVTTLVKSCARYT